MTKHYKQSRTYHLPFSEGLQNDDRKIQDEFCFNGKTVAVTIKRDGEGSSLYNNGYHARSLSSVHHPSRCWIKAEHARIRNLIPEGWKIFCENIYSRKSIHYYNLDSYLEVINIFDENRNALKLDNVLEWCKLLDLIHVPILDVIKIEGNDFSKIQELSEKVISEGEEGIVIRNVESFPFSDYLINVAKTVRKGHIQPNEIHWMKQEIVPNRLKPKFDHNGECLECDRLASDCICLK